MLRECFEEEEGRYEQLSRCSFVICIVVVMIQGSVKRVHGEGRKEGRKRQKKKKLLDPERVTVLFQRPMRPLAIIFS